jgi:putative phosphoribosyl transferase
MRLFQNRTQAAQKLADDLVFLKSAEPVVLALANGGVPIGDVVARALAAPLDVLIIEKLYVPQFPNTCVGVMDEHGRISVTQGSNRWHHLTQQDLAEPARAAFPEIQRRHNAIRAILPEVDIRGRTVIVVDDGVATGSKMLGAITNAKERGAARVVVAAPAGATEGTWQLHATADQVVIPHRPTKFKGIECFYEEFPAITDAHVAATLEAWVRDHHPQDHGGVKTVVLKLVNTHQQPLMAEVDLPLNLQRGQRYPAVIFAHGFESTARSPRSMAVSEQLAARGVICVRMDFTGHGRSGGSISDANDRQMREDLRTVVNAVRRLKEVDRDRLAVAGSGVGAMIALQFAEQDAGLRALVLRGPVCNIEAVHANVVQTPTLIIHAEDDTALFDAVDSLNRELAGRHRLVCISHTNRLFDNPACRNAMVGATVDWLVEQLSPQSPVPPPLANASNGTNGTDAANGAVETSQTAASAS